MPSLELGFCISRVVLALSLKLIQKGRQKGKGKEVVIRPKKEATNRPRGGRGVGCLLNSAVCGVSDTARNLSYFWALFSQCLLSSCL
jgi:hypothetical protein